jgi:hypothetical protein
VVVEVTVGVLVLVGVALLVGGGVDAAVFDIVGVTVGVTVIVGVIVCVGVTVGVGVGVRGNGTTIEYVVLYIGEYTSYVPQ